MRKLKLYLDTSVLSHIDASDAPEFEDVTRRFFEYVAKYSDEYELVISPVVEFEIEKCPEPKLTRLIDYLAHIKVVRLAENPDALILADAYVSEGVLPEKELRDLLHVAYATTSRCDYVVSWNMKHLVNAKTIARCTDVNFRYKYSGINIVIPSVVIGDEI